MPHIQHVNLLVEDLDAAVAFYEEVLGFVRTETPAFDFPAQFVAVGDGGQELHINQLDDVKQERGHFCVRLDDFSAAFLRAQAIGAVETEAWGPVRRLPTGVMQAFVRDPSGNLVEISCEADQEVDAAILEQAAANSSSC